MKITNLMGCKVHVCENDLFKTTDDVVIRRVDEESWSLLLEFFSPIKTGKHHCLFAVARPRSNAATSEKFMMEEFMRGRQLSCNLTCIPHERYDPETPFDLSWWRGGGAEIVGIYLTENDRHADLVEISEKIKTKADFVSFVALLLEDLKNSPPEWENNTLESYLDAMGRWTDGMEGYYKNMGINTIEYDKINWRIFADILLAARVYE
jgi:hypothetical protein